MLDFLNPRLGTTGRIVATLAAATTLACFNSNNSTTKVQESDEARIAGERGVPISASAPSFMPKHLTGPNAGKTACPLCIYGLGPQIQLWVDEEQLEKSFPLIRQLDSLAQSAPEKPSEKRDGFTPYVILAARSGNKIAPQTQKQIEALGVKRVFFVEVPSWDDVETSALYGHSKKDRPGSRGYLVINRRVFQRWEKPGVEQLPNIEKALEAGREHVATYEVADAQVAPTWEPGQRLLVRFRIIGSDGKPLAKQKVGAYHTNTEGLYNPRGWNRRLPVLATNAWTNADGWIDFDCIMPGVYPTRDEPAHIHFSTQINGKAQFRTLWFEGDTLLTAERRVWADRDKETVIVPIDRSQRVWRVEHTFQLD